MKRPAAHQIDEKAQRLLRDAFPATWVVNRHEIDYGKDYQIEIVEDDGELTGTSFYVQLKGHTKADVSSDGTLVRHSLQSKHARYYADKVRDLPVFLIVIELSTKRGWWLFLQQSLDADQSWRKLATHTVGLRMSDAISDVAAIRNAVEEAKKWMRLRHPESIHETVIAHKAKIAATDPRFDVRVSLENDRPIFKLLPKETVPLRIEIKGKVDSIRGKINDLLDKGGIVAFEAGEVSIVGSKLFEEVERVGFQMQFEVTKEVDLTITSMDKDGNELARLREIPGKFTGGQRELWFSGELCASPLTVKFGPVAPNCGGAFSFHLDPQRWNGQHILRLAYFDRLLEFVQSMSSAASIKAQCEDHGNVVFTATMPLETQPFAIGFCKYLQTLAKGRKVCSRVNVNPVWTIATFDRDAQETFEELDAIFSGAGYSKPSPKLRLKLGCVSHTLSPHLVLPSKKPEHFMIVSTMTYSFMGESVEVGTVRYEFTEVLARMNDSTSRGRQSQVMQKRRRKVSAIPQRNAKCELLLIGTPNTVVNARLADVEAG